MLSKTPVVNLYIYEAKDMSHVFINYTASITRHQASCWGASHDSAGSSSRVYIKTVRASALTHPNTSTKMDKPVPMFAWLFGFQEVDKSVVCLDMLNMD